MSESDESHLPISGLQHLAFCPRQWGLIHLEQVWKENRLTAEGRLLHERADLPGQSRRDQIRTVRGMWLRSDRLALTGRADLVEFKPEPYPVEYKRGKRKPNDCDAVQLCAQALCLEEMLKFSTTLSRRRHTGCTTRTALPQLLPRRSLPAGFNGWDCRHAEVAG